ncbi:hypothetical protein BBP40_011547, partial [Aspergillus hancockii]
MGKAEVEGALNLDIVPGTNQGRVITHVSISGTACKTPEEKRQLLVTPHGSPVGGDYIQARFVAEITTINNETHATSTAVPGFSVTWQFDQASEKQVVHAFPNIKADDTLPPALHEVQQLNLNIHWTYGVGNETVNSTNIARLNDVSANTNVALDLFFDGDRKAAQNVLLAKSEMMVWFAGLGDAHPFGSEDGVVKTKAPNGSTFNLYAGRNGLGQNVLSWLAANTTEKFKGDIYPLISELFSLKGDVHLSKTDYLGHFSLGTEAFSPKSNITLWVPTLDVGFQVEGQTQNGADVDRGLTNMP